MRVLSIIVVGSSTLSTSFAQSPSSYRPTCSTGDQQICCEMTNDKFEGAISFCSDHGCSQSSCSAKPSGGDSTWSSGSGGVSKWGKDDDDVWSTTKATSWGGSTTKATSWGGGDTSHQWGDWGAGWVSVGVGHPTSRPRSRQQRRLRGHQFRATPSQRPTTHHQPPSLTTHHRRRQLPRLLKLVAQVVKTSAQRNSPC